MPFSSVDLGVHHERCQDSILSMKGKLKLLRVLSKVTLASQDSTPGILLYSALLFVVGL